MTKGEDLPEEKLLNIFSRLPVKSLIGFSSVSKRMHSIIFSDPKFAQLQFKAARQHKRLLLYPGAPKLESLPLDDTTSFGDPSAVRKFALPFVQEYGDHVKFLGSCNGLIFLAFLKKLIFISSYYNSMMWYYGAAYLPATDDYKVLVTSCNEDDWEFEIQLFSLRTHSWKSIHTLVRLFSLGIVSHEALHWINYLEEHEMACFDLVEEAFRRMPLPSFDGDGKRISELGVCGGCLCVLRYPMGAWDSIDFWVMREYEASDSWTMIYSLKLSDPPNMPQPPCVILVLERRVVAMYWNVGVYELIRIDHKKEGNRLQRYMLEGDWSSMIEYEESLLWISDLNR